MMRDAILNFPKQFAFEPVIQNAGAWERPERVIACGMGGSALAADLLTLARPELDLTVYRDYGLPRLAEADMRRRAVIAVSYSGNTEETLSSAEEALGRGLPLAAVGVAGKLLTLARERGIPHVAIPDTGIQPRSATGFVLRSLLALMGDTEGLRLTAELASALDPKSFMRQGEELSHDLRGTIPVIYASTKNAPVARHWKIKFNETGKIPAFWNVLPELNHNEMTAFDGQGKTAKLGRSCSFILLADSADDPRIQKRMTVLQKLLEDRRHTVRAVPLSGANVFHKMFSSFLIADWAALFTAERYGADPEQVPMVEEFKKLIR